MEQMLAHRERPITALTSMERRPPRLGRRLATAVEGRASAMKIVFTASMYGDGALFRSLELARALAGHRVILVAGGQEVAVDLPAHVELLRLPVSSWTSASRP